MAKTTTKSEATTEATETDAKQAAPRRPCMDGCGGFPKGRRANFLPGHDAKLRGIFLRAELAEADDVTDFERDESAREMAAVVNVEWARNWFETKHGGK